MSNFYNNNNLLFIIIIIYFFSWYYIIIIVVRLVLNNISRQIRQLDWIHILHSPKSHVWIGPNFKAFLEGINHQFNLNYLLKLEKIKNKLLILGNFAPFSASIKIKKNKKKKEKEIALLIRNPTLGFARWIL